MIVYYWYIAAGVQALITILLAYQFFRYKTHDNPLKSSLSVIIAARNEASNLKKLIPKLIEQQYDAFEIIIALDRCSDDSLSLLQSFENEKLRIINIKDTPAGYNPKKYALTKAVEAATGDWLVFTDADCSPYSNNWLSSLQSRMTTEKDIVLGYSPYLNTGGLLGNLIQYEAFLTAFNFLSITMLRRPYMGVGRNMAIRKSFFEKKNGYEPFKGITGGDDDLFIQHHATYANSTIALGKDAVVHTYPQTSWKGYLRQKTRHLSVGGQYKTADKLFHLVFNGSAAVFWILTPFNFQIDTYHVLLFLLFIKLMGYRFAVNKMGVGFNYIWLPLVDLVYSVFIPAAALRSKLVKDIRWKD